MIATLKTTITEKQWQGQVVQLARLLGWKNIYHTWNSMHSAQGFPDLTLVRERLIFVELKSHKGECTSHQLDWIEKLRQAGQEVYVWRPDDFDEAVKVLGRR